MQNESAEILKKWNLLILIVNRQQKTANGAGTTLIETMVIMIHVTVTLRGLKITLINLSKDVPKTIS